MNTSARLLPLHVHPDDSGLLTIGETGAQLPFVPQRFFAITGVPATAVRGRHAHRRCMQLVVALSGSCRLKLVDGSGQDEVHLHSPAEALFIPTMVWAELFDFTPDTVVLVLASTLFDESEYIRSLAEFLKIVTP